ncbi:MAG: type I glutamate--ammonia ligase [Acidobacteria bacterium]|nr:type I glutamate--ammonia ligase [Acidobacteriota bacterium]NIM62660.1 type I glutamate--ammonia ligase [Acidobacteriota bacterium]NIO59900.1 type I glutamate--ammonia ligase [Acidobacteriota bacterium]NIQ86074.1 type I glutamate--ammonia ligase [Acidobacteriota bacterium]NIT11590.1 type I glutamate--ammonia ligase [Acidobacteriota bacterium]
MTPKDFFEYAKKHGAEMVDLKFTDLLGTWQHCSFPIDTWDENTFEDGVGFDGSSIRGWQAINVSDMLAVPDPSTAMIDPFFAKPTVSVIADIKDPMTREDYSRDPRHVARKALSHLKETGIADRCYIGPEPEFFIFDEVRYEQNQHRGFYQIDSVEGAWNTGRFEEPNLGYKPSYKGGYFPVSPTDTYHDLRGEMVRAMRKVGITVEAHHHEVGTAGQGEIDMKYAPLLEMADQFMWFKYIIKNVAKRHGKTVTFMPKPIFEDNGSGMHTHISLWKGGEPLFAGDEYSGLSQMALWAVGGLLKHAPSVLAFAAPTSNSYRRLVPGFEAPVNLAMSARNRSAAVRIPMYSQSPKAKRIEFRCPDPTCNGYLSFAAIMMACLDGIKNKIDPGQPLDQDIYEMTAEELAEYRHTPGRLDEALEALDRDHEFLTAGGVFTADLIETWIQYKTDNEVDPLRLRPHPYEFYLYYDN